MDAVERVTHRIRTEGIEAALDALLGVCRDEKSAAPARSSAGTAIFRAAGFFDANREDATKKAPSEMSPQELAAALQKLKRELSERSPPDEAEGEEDTDLDGEPGEGDKKGQLFD
ncbi:MAG: hypothetical protein JNK47_11110 [Mesorhizobium sp.]|nr:hypothetical protein [Mesorhizobium sp.]MBL8577768.1 hypothetical protein [Mesorhizobium sp.]